MSNQYFRSSFSPAPTPSRRQAVRTLYEPNVITETLVPSVIMDLLITGLQRRLFLCVRKEKNVIKVEGFVNCK